MPSEERIQCQVLSYFSVTLSFSRLINSAERYFVTRLMIFCSVPSGLGPVDSAGSFYKVSAWPQLSVSRSLQTGLSHQTASVAKVSNHAPAGISCNSRATWVDYRTRVVVDRDKPRNMENYPLLLIPYEILVTAQRPNSPFPLDLTGTGTRPGACQ